MADSSHRINASPSPTVDRVEPVLLGAGDPTGEVAAGLAKELPREVCATTEIDQATDRLGAFHDYCVQADVRELTRLSARCAATSPRCWPGTPPQ